MTAAAAPTTITLPKAFALREADRELNTGGPGVANGVAGTQVAQTKLAREDGRDGVAIRAKRRNKHRIDPTPT